MKLVGFIKEYHGKTEEAVSFNEFVNPKVGLAYDRFKLIKYLKQGDILIAWMGYVHDFKTKQPLVPDGCETDGIWVWPSYFPYYLGIYREVNIDQEFLSYIEQKDYLFQLDPEYPLHKNEFQIAALDKLYGP
jgi:hypothetical protein